MTEQGRMRIVERNGGFSVVVIEDGVPVKKAGPFHSSEKAWRWIDAHSDEGRDDTDRYNRIRVAFSER